MKVRVKLVSGGELTVEVAEEETMATLRERVRDLEGREEYYTLEMFVFNRKILSLDQTAQTAGITDGSLLQQVRRGVR